MDDAPDLGRATVPDPHDRARARRTIAALGRLAEQLARTDRVLTQYTPQVRHDPRFRASP